MIIRNTTIPLVLVSTLLASANLSYAVPVNPTPQTYTQADGSTFIATPRGDEHIAWLETAANEILVLNRESRNYEYGQIDLVGEQTQLKSSGIVFGQTGMTLPTVNVNDLRNAWAGAWEASGAISHDEHESSPEAGESSGSQVSSGSPSASSGDTKFDSLFIMVEFDDVQFTDDEHYWSQKIYGGYPGELAYGTVNHYYQEVSQGKVLFVPAEENFNTVNDGMIRVRLNQNHPHYGQGGSSYWRKELSAAFKLADQYIDFSKYDTNGDGEVKRDELSVNFIVAGLESSSIGSDTEGFWGHAYFNISPGGDDGVINYDDVDVVTGYMGFGERMELGGVRQNSTLGVIVHELGHSVFKLLDLYNGPNAVGQWGLMGSGSWGRKSGELQGSRPVHILGAGKISAKMKSNEQGFIPALNKLSLDSTPEEVHFGHAHGDHYNIVKIDAPYYPHKFWVLEQRKMQGYDEALVSEHTGLVEGDSGILLYKRDTGSNYKIVRADNSSSISVRKSNLFYAGNVTEANSDNYEHITLSDGLVLQDVSTPSEIMTAKISRDVWACSAFSSTLTEHETAGRAYWVEEGWLKTKRYYAEGSHEDLGTVSSWSDPSITLYESKPNYFTTDSACYGDTQNPVITLQGDENISLNVGDEWIEPGYSANDETSGDITSDVVITGQVNTLRAGIYELLYTVRDYAGNPAEEQTRTVTVGQQGEDTTAPVITLIGGAVSLEQGEQYIESGYSASDDRDGNLTSDVMVSGFVDTNTIGVYTLYYNVTDTAGNSAVEVTRQVSVTEPSLDSTPPVITLNGSSEITVQKDSAYTEAGWSATDNTGGDITNQVIVTGNVNTSVPGTYVLYYNVSDAAGNAADEVSRTVHVKATPSCNEYTDSVSNHISAGRGYQCGSFNMYGCANGSNQEMGSRYGISNVTLKKTGENYYEIGTCN